MYILFKQPGYSMLSKDQVRSQVTDCQYQASKRMVYEIGFLFFYEIG